MALGFSTSSFHSNFNNLSIESQDQAMKTDHGGERYPATSLLSANLAAESNRTYNKPHTFHPEEQYDHNNFTDDHPEPELLATSVGKDLEGRLIPSSSTISLLSLSNNNNNNSTPNITGSIGYGPSSYGDSHTTLTGKMLQMTPAHPTNVFTNNAAAMTTADRKSSYGNLRSRNSITHLSQQRLLLYHRTLTPNVTQMAQFETSPQHGAQPRNPIFAPDSPSLDPTSLGGSPLRFWLNAQTPPNLMQRIRNMMAAAAVNEYHALPSNQTQPAQISQNSVLQAIDIGRRASDSPTLNPVQTPLEEVPMTPLYLNPGDNYFVLTNGSNGYGELETQEERVEDLDEEMESGEE